MTKKRITFITTIKFHQEIKKRSADRGVSITRYIHKAIWEQIKKEKQYEDGILIEESLNQES